MTRVADRGRTGPDERSLQRALDAGRTAIGRACADLNRLAERFDETAPIVNLLAACSGHVVVTGLGKSGLVGAKLAATLSSTGTPAFFVHATDALHGDSGSLSGDDVLLAISKSGETTEVFAFATLAREWGHPVVAVTGCGGVSPLARLATHTIDASVSCEADPWDIVPTTSTSVVMMLGDALAVALMIAKERGPDHFGRRHPAGILGERVAVGRVAR